MKRKTVDVLVTYKFRVSYSHDEHLRNIEHELKSHPLMEICGAGVVSDGTVHGYTCRFNGSIHIEIEAPK